jgi:hypothetical protein
MERLTTNIAFSLLVVAYICFLYWKPQVLVCPVDNKLSKNESILSSLINSEAAANDTIDAYLVGSTVLNRRDHDKFPGLIKDVIFQRRQYDGVNHNFYRTDFSDTIAVRLLKGIGRNYQVYYFLNSSATNKAFINYTKTLVLIYETKHHKFFGL